jgi:hypothetical protein
MPKSPRDVDPETGVKILRLLEAIDDHDDVQAEYSDMNMTSSILALLDEA